MKKLSFLLLDVITAAADRW